MKLLSPSSSSSASSTATTAFYGNSTRKTASCIAGVFRRLLCYNSLPTYLSDYYFKEAAIEPNQPNAVQCEKAEDKVEVPAIPGLVARLMGLESMPQIDLAATTLSSISNLRSISMNSVDSSREIESIQGSCQRVKSSCEAPTIFETEDEHFLILSFESGVKSKGLGLKTRKLDMGSEDLKQRRVNRNRNKGSMRKYENSKENQDINKVLVETVIIDRPTEKVRNYDKVGDSNYLSHPIQNFQRNSHADMEGVEKPRRNHEQKYEESKLREKANCLPVRVAEIETDSENSSPISVLDFEEFITSPRVPTSEESLMLSNSNSRRKLSEKLESCRQSLQGKVNKDCEAQRNEGKSIESKKTGNHSQSHLKLLGAFCTFAEADLIQCNWMNKEMSVLEEFREVGADFGQEILNQLLLEVVDQLLGKSMNNFDIYQYFNIM